MEVYNIPQHGHADTYLIQGTESNPHLASPSVEQFETMYSAGAPEFALQQGMYYPSATNYGYFYTGMESPNDWDDHQRIFGLDGQEIQYAGAQTENFPYLYYTPSYGYPESQYNPYNPYIPGALIGLDGSYIGSHQYYTVPSYDTTSSAPSYYPMVVQSRPDIPPNSTAEPFLNASASSIAYRNDISSLKQNMSSTSAAFTRNPSRVTSDLKKSFTMVSGGSKVNVGLNRQPYANGSVSSNVFTSAAASNAFQGRGTQIVDNLSHGKVWSNRNQLKVAPIANGLSSFGSSAHRKTLIDKVQTKVNAGSGSPDVSFEQNRGLRTSTPLKQLPVKAYTSMAGESDSKGSIVIHKDMYNKHDFPLDYVNAKFFVIKSYSEDDVHKSIKYNVWSSTPNGNKKLYIAYDDAQRIAAEESKGCPIFLFFSVNASGQFCGVAEMTGAVDFHKDMDFWQQDKWCGSFPVKWHFIKDVPNPNFRHIILENNENKPVTNSRDTQEIRYKKGMEMLKIFKHYTSKTCILDDFMYYDNRQNLLKQEKARFLNKSYENPFILPHIEPPRRLSGVLNLPLNKDAQLQKDNDDRNAKIVAISTEQILVNKEALGAAIANDSIATENKVEKDIGLLKIGSLSINPKKSNINPVGNGAPAPITSPAHATETVSAKPVEVVTVGSMPVKVNGFANSVGSLIVGTIPLDPKALNLNEAV